MSGARTEPAGRSFADVWAEKIYPAIQDDYAKILCRAPTRMIARKQARAEKKVKKKEKKERKADEKDDGEEPSDPEAASAGDADVEEKMKEIATTVQEKRENAMCT